MLDIEVAYASLTEVAIVKLQVQEGTTIQQAIAQSALQVDLSLQRVGIFGELKALTDEVKRGDRVEIYRPLKQSALEARKQRAKAARAAKRR